MRPEIHPQALMCEAGGWPSLARHGSLGHSRVGIDVHFLEEPTEDLNHGLVGLRILSWQPRGLRRRYGTKATLQCGMGAVPWLPLTAS